MAAPSSRKYIGTVRSCGAGMRRDDDASIFAVAYPNYIRKVYGISGAVLENYDEKTVAEIPHCLVG